MKHSTEGTYEGTGDLVEALIAESKHLYGWRPVRAAVLFALRDAQPAPEGTVYVTPEDLKIWISEAKALSKARGDGLKATGALGLTAFQLRAMTAGANNRPPTGVKSKAVALAMAHYTAGLKMPVPAEDPDALDAWFRPRFRGTDRVAEWLQMDPKTLSNRLRGYRLEGDRRITILPEAHLIRALDWIANVGPFCPYGPKPAVDIWPGQSEEL